MKIKASIKLFFAVVVALLLWFYMFSPWTSGLSNFWLNMSISAVVLTVLALCFGGLGDLILPKSEISKLPIALGRWQSCEHVGKSSVGKSSGDRTIASQSIGLNVLGQIFLGVAIAFALWGIFWIGDKLSQLLFDFARTQVDNVYGMKFGTSPALIAALLLFVIGPAEEFFWRGFVQRKLGELMPGKTFAAMVITTAIYALAHIWSFNFMLVMAALVAGAVWALLYYLKPHWLPSLIISHALWDALVFVLLPI